MKRRPRRSTASGENPVSLFPFLAVLICTMGVLILLLVILVRQARLRALAEALAHTQPATPAAELPSEEELRQLEEDLQWQAEQLRLSREKTQEQLNEGRLMLGHIENSLRRLRQEAEDWRQRLRDLEQSRAANESERFQRMQHLQAELESLRRRIDNLKSELEKAKQAPAPRSYAILPYVGPHGTTRRPIYLECRADGVYLQPEGIRFTPSDFFGPLGPGNPLDAALRAVREELLARREFDPQKDREPYPLLIVRPSGIEAYYAARAAMTSWGTEFGYELVEEDWKLAYPPPDPRLARAVEEAVALARRRQEFLAQSAPGRYGGRPRQFRPAPYVGGAIEESPSADVGPRADPMLAMWQEKVRGTGAQPTSLTQQAEEGAKSGGVPPAGSVARTSSPNKAELTISDRPSLPPEDVKGQTPDAGVTIFPQTIAGTAHRSTKPTLASGAPPETSQANPNITISSARPLAERYGQNWGLVSHERNAIPVTRPIRIECYPDRYVMVSDERQNTTRVFWLSEGAEKAVEGLVTAIKEAVNDWGIAGRGMYWRPILRVHVAPGGERQFELLKVLLSGSGLVVEKAS